MASVSSSSYEGRYFRFTVTQSGTSTTVNWKFEVLGGSASYYSTSPINCYINGVNVYSLSATTYSTQKYPAAKGSKSGTYNIGKYGSFTIKLSGRPYYSSAGTAKTSTVTLTAPTYKITYNANGGTGAPASQTKTYGTTLTLSSVIPTRASVIEDNITIHYTFKGWATSASATTATYTAGGSYTANSAATLYAVWSTKRIENIISYDVVYNTINGSYIQSQIKLKEKNLTLTDNIPIKHGYTFSSWNTKIDGTGTKYIPKSIYSIDKDIILYAIWIPWSHTVKYSANGCYSKVPDDFIKTTDEAVFITGEPTRKKYKFREWNTKKDGTGISYHAGDYYDATYNGGTITLYAIWTREDIYIYKNNTCSAIEFVEGAESLSIDRDGIVYSPEFIENDTIQVAKDGFHCFEIMESYGVFNLIDGDNATLTDESGNRLYATIHV